MLAIFGLHPSPATTLNNKLQKRLARYDIEAPRPASGNVTSSQDAGPVSSVGQCYIAFMVASLVIVASLFSPMHAPVLMGRPLARAPEPLVLLADGYAQPTSLRVWGRVLSPKARAKEGKDDAPLKNLARTLSDLDTDELRGVDVNVTVAGQTFVTTTDKDGVFVVRVKGLQKPLSPGVLPVEATALSSKATASLYVAPAEGIAVVSDVDDTIVKTWVTDKLKMAGVVLTKNATQLEPVVGASAAYRRAAKEGAVAFFYLSGSPQNLGLRLQQFIVDHDYPRGPLLLKNLGKDSLFSHDSYKLSRLEELANAHPKLRFVLVGDSGERDPEIYRTFREKYPERVVAIVIRKVPGSKHVEPLRFANMTLVDDVYPDDAVIAVAVSQGAKP